VGRFDSTYGPKTWNKIGYNKFVIEEGTMDKEVQEMELGLHEEFVYDQESVEILDHVELQEKDKEV
jgi:hypothetical protein